MLLVAFLGYFWFLFISAVVAGDKIEAWKTLNAGGVASASRRGRLSRAVTMTSMNADESSNKFQNMKDFFLNQIKQMDDFRHVTNDPSFSKFDFALYLELNVRESIVYLLEFHWLSLGVFFILLTLSHYYLHVTYVGICICAFSISFLICLIQFWYIQSHKNLIADHQLTPRRFNEIELSSFSLSNLMMNEAKVTLQFALFFVCYGFSRMILGPSMWQLYFWTTLGMAIGFLLFAGFFILFMADCVSVFSALTAIPPYLAENHTHNIKIAMTECKAARSNKPPLVSPR